MQYIYRILIAVTISVPAFSHSYFMADAFDPLPGVVVLVAALMIFFFDLLFRNIEAETMMRAGFGAFIGLIFGFVLFLVIKNIAGGIAELPKAGMNSFGPAMVLIPMTLFGYIGYRLQAGLRIRTGSGNGGFGQEQSGSTNPEKILDTSVIIDGRILDIAETHFIDGPFIIPNFVLREIQLISDSPDPIKRNRGRRGLDMLNKLQQHGTVKVKISYVDYTETREVDAKLVKLSRELNAKLVTNDFNLNKVAELQGVKVLNLNNLTNALKPVVLPGEDIYIDVIKEGKDENQGIGYLEDGTMVVIENGGTLLGKTVKVNVTSIIQTAAGKMIFTRASGVVDADDQQPPGGQQQQKDPQQRGGGRYGRSRRGGGGRSQRDSGNNSGNGGSGDSDESGGREMAQGRRRGR